MDMIALIIALSVTMWYIIQRGKDEFWGKYSFGKWITISCAAILGFFLTFSFNIDIIYATGFVKEVTFAGIVLTCLTLMSGSSAVSEIIEKIKGITK